MWTRQHLVAELSAAIVALAGRQGRPDQPVFSWTFIEAVNEPTAQSNAGILNQV